MFYYEVLKKPSSLLKMPSLLFTLSRCRTDVTGFFFSFAEENSGAMKNNKRETSVNLDPLG